jgi:Transposase, Mutator family
MTETIGPMAARIDQKQLARKMVDQARAKGVHLVGEGGLLTGLTKAVVETALEEELSDHLGYDKHDPAGRNGANSRNGTRAKTVLTEIGPVEIEAPRDRDGSFELFAEVYGAKVSKDTISRITDKVVEEMTEWRRRRLPVTSRRSSSLATYRGPRCTWWPSTTGRWTLAGSYLMVFLALAAGWVIAPGEVTLRVAPHDTELDVADAPVGGSPS